jgi:hypothetical protein
MHRAAAFAKNQYLSAMKNQVTRTILLLGISIALFAVILWVPAPKNPTLFDILRGASGGFGLAGCISFVLLLKNELKGKGKAL